MRSKMQGIPFQHHRTSFWDTALPPRLAQNRKLLSLNLKHKLLRSSQDFASSKQAATASAAPGLSSTYAGPALAKALRATVGCSSCQATFASASLKRSRLEYPKKKWVSFAWACNGSDCCAGRCASTSPTAAVTQSAQRMESATHEMMCRAKLLDILEPSLAMRADQPHLLNAGVKQCMRA